MSGQRSRVCPHLGLMHDTGTHMGFPSSENRCFNSKSARSPDLSYQQGFCLRAAYNQCAFYDDNGINPIPSGIHAVRSAFGMSSKMIFVFVALLIVVGATLIGRTGWKDFPGDLFSAPGSATELPLSPILVSSSATVTVVPVSETETSAPEVALLFTETPAPMSIPIDASTPQPGGTITSLSYLHGFEVTKMPLGSDHGYLVHVVAIGETLDGIADHYNTTVEAIMTVNYGLKPPVWVQYPIVIPVDTKDAAGLPAFKVYVVEAYEAISAESLAEVLGVDASMLEFYNLCTANCQFNKGDVLLVPYTE